MDLYKGVFSYILIFLCWSETFGKKTSAIDRVYHLGNVPQGIQYYASASPSLIYPNIPAAVYIPGQIGVLNLPPGVTVQTPPPNTPPTEATPTYHTPYPSRPAHPAYYHQQQGSSSFSIEQSVDLSETSKRPGSASTYGPPKALDVPYRRPQGPPPHHRTYNRYKNYPPFPSRSPSRPSGRPLMYTHYHKGHLHTHYVPSSVASFKPSKPGYLPTTTPLPPPSISSEDPQKVYNHHAHPGPASAPSSNLNNLVRFPSASHDDLTQAFIGQTGVINNYDASLPVKIPNKKPNQLEVKDILKNADLHFVDVLENKPTTPNSHLQKFQPTVKPELANHASQSFRPSIPAQEYQQQQPQSQYPGFSQQEERYPISQVYQPQQPQQPVFSFPVQGFHQQPLRNYAELYDHRFQVPQAFHNNHLEQDVGSSETYKVPVAIFKGVVPGMISAPVERSDEGSIQSSSLPSDFTPSKRTSDWIPVTGGGSPAIHSKPETVRNLNQFGDDYFADLSKQSSAEANKFSMNDHQNSYIIDTTSSNGHQNFPVAEKLTRNPDDTIYGTTSGNFESVRIKNEKVGDIISGKIPGAHNPFGKIGERSPNNLNSGSITTSSGNIRDGSNLVVSSVIKFSR